MEEEKEVRKSILKKLFRHRYIGGRHTEIRNVIKGLPPEQLKEAKKQESFLNSLKKFMILTE